MSTILKIKNNVTEEYHSIDVIKYSIEYSKTWGSSVQNMEGSTRSTLIGIYPIIKVTTATMYQKDARLIGNLLNQGLLYIRFYDSISGTTQEEMYTASDISVDMIRETGKWYEELSFTLKPIDIQGVVS